jgi:hypothetical protein
MKKIVCCLLGALLVTGVLFTVKAAPQFTNGGFDKSIVKGLPPGWNARTLLKNNKRVKSPFELDDHDKREGAKALKVKLSGNEKIVLLNCKLGKVTPGKVYELSFWCKITGKSRFYLRENHIKKNGKFRAELFKNHAKLKHPAAWKKNIIRIKTYSEDAALGITIFMKGGPGAVWLDGFKIEEYKIKTGNEVSFQLSPNHYTDNNLFYLPQYAPLVMYWNCANKVQLKPQNPRVVFELPSQIKLLSCGYDAKLLKKTSIAGEYVRYEYTMGVPKTVMRSCDFAKSAYNSVIPMIYTDSKTVGKEYDCRMFYKDDKITCAPVEFRIKITPPLPASPRPELFNSGIFAGTSVEFYDKPLERWFKFYRSCGFNNIYLPDILRAGSLSRKHKRNPQAVFTEAAKSGIAAFMCSGQLTNGYVLRYTQANYDAPDSVKVKRANGKIDKSAFDPAYIIRKGKWYAKGIKQVVAQAVKYKCKGIWVNWEPYRFIGKNGSFTDLSKRDFAKFAKLPVKKVLAMSAMKIVDDYREKLYDFQSKQYADAMKSISEMLKKSSRELNYPLKVIVCSSNVFFVPRKELKIPGHIRFRRTFKPEQWLKYVEHLSSWYYLYFNADEYLNSDTKKLVDLGFRIPEYHQFQATSFYNTLENVEKYTLFIKEQCRKDGLPQASYLHLIQAKQCTNWVVTPEAIGLQMLSAFIGGAFGVGLYYFPNGYDGRYWRSAIEANRAIAMFEKIVMTGHKLNSGFKAKPMSKLFKCSSGDFAKRLTVRAFEKNGEYLVAICNFDFLAPSPCSLQFNLPAGRYTVSEPLKNKYYRTEKQPWLSAVDLKSLPFFAEPMSIHFLKITKFSDNIPAGKPVILTTVREKNISQCPFLNRKSEERLRKSNSLRSQLGCERRDLSSLKAFKSIKKSGFITAIITKNGESLFKIRKGKETFIISPDCRGAIVSWKFGELEIAGAGTKNQIGFDRIYMPAKSRSKEKKIFYSFVAQNVSGKLLRLKLCRRITKGALKGLHIYKTYVFHSKNSGFIIEYELKNKINECMVGFWVWNCFAQAYWKYNAEIEIGKLKLKSMALKTNTFCEYKKNASIRKLLSSAIFKKIDSDLVVLKSKIGTVSIKTDIKKLAGYLVWSVDSTKCNTLETLFASVEVARGNSAEFRLKYSFSN